MTPAEGIIVGLGNPIMSDDGIGLKVSQALHERLPQYDLDLTCSNGFDIVDRIGGYRTAVIIDSMVTGAHPPGTVLRLDLDAAPVTVRSSDAHGVGFSEAIRVAAAIGATMPAVVLVYGIEVTDPFRVGDRIAPDVLARVAAIAGEVAEDVMRENRGGACTSSR